MIEWVTGDLLTANVEALVNTVNTVGVMGKGIALRFRSAYPANYGAYRSLCQAGFLFPGGVFAFDLGADMAPRYVLNVATKGHSRDPSRLEWVDLGLGTLVSLVRDMGIRSIAVPPLGCGNGGLAWGAVKPRLARAFQPLPEVRVLLVEPAVP